jgi:peptidoglycan/LPS O-acetylase OafA/YrhL
MAMRYLRLWPVYFLGAILGLASAWLHALPGRDNLTQSQVLHTAPFALAMLPGPHIKPMLYPVNSVAWSLGLELLVNLAYAWCWRPLRDARVLAGVLVVSALALVGAAAHFGKLDIGFEWSDAVGGLPRVAFSFTAGLALNQLFRRRPWTLRIPAWAPLAALPPLFYAYVDQIVWPLACVILLFPTIVAAAAGAEPRGQTARVFAWLGAVSYPLYTLHKPAAELMALAVRQVSPHDLRTVWIGLVFMACLVLACDLVERVYDRPVRRLLMRGLDGAIGLAGRKRAPAAEPAGLAADASA